MDKKSRDLIMAKLYLNNKDYKMAEKSFKEYLSVCPDNVSAIRLLAQVYEQNREFNKALEAYERCYLTEPDRTGLLLDICRILCQGETKIDPADSRKWLNLAAKAFPSNPIVSRCERVLMSGSSSERPMPVDDTLKIIMEKLSLIENKIDRFSEIVKNLPTGSDLNLQVNPLSPINDSEPHEPTTQDDQPYQEEELPIESFCEMKPIEVKTGEEDEDIVFEHRCKLYRFKDKEYKERGLGNIKILKHRETGKGRLIMRRDLIGLVCLNCWNCHGFERVKDTQLKFAGVDASDGSPEPTIFLAKFKTMELTDEFQRHLKDLFSDTPSGPSESKPEIELVELGPERVEPRLERVEPKPERIEPKPERVEPKPERVELKLDQISISKTPQFQLPTLFNSSFNSPPIKSTFTFGNSPFFKSPVTTDVNKECPANTASEEAPASETRNYFAESINKISSGFNFKMQINPLSHMNDSEPHEPTTQDDQPYQEEELPIESFCEMKPIEVKTGEEDEDIVFEHRCKLYRFKDKEYKERGLGNIKILKHRETGKGRLIMRRDLIGLVCLNCWNCHGFERVKDTQLKFAGVDASDGSPEPTIFLAKFKTMELTDGFERHLKDLFSDTPSGPSESKPEIELVDPKLDQNLVDKARQLQLPDLFYHKLKNQEPCKGCNGCGNDDS